MARRKVPSQAASGAETFSDSLVGRQITDGTSQLTNTNFAIDRVIPERDVKTFRSGQFSDFLTLDDLKDEKYKSEEEVTESRKKEVKFRSSKNDAGKSLFGSLKNRISSSITNIIKKFPAGILIDKDSLTRTSNYTIENITYDVSLDNTQFEVDFGRLYNPFDVIFVKPKSQVNPNTLNKLRDFYSSYTKYVIEISGVTYDIVNYNEPNINNRLRFKVKGKPFNGLLNFNGNVLIRPNNGIVEEFYSKLDELEQCLLDRDTNPKYTATFSVPKDSLDQSQTVLADVEITWPLSKDNWNIKIVGIDYDLYIREISDVAEQVDDYKSNLFVRFMSSPQLFEFDTEDKKAEAIFQLYGHSFDKVKKYIENIAYMRNVSYDGINNLPDILLKNLSNTLGLSTVNLFDEKKLEDLLYTRQDTQYSGLTIGKTVVDAENEFYRRLLVNLSYIYKSKGTRSSIEFFLRFLGAPEPMIKINEFVYEITSLPKSYDLDGDIYDVVSGVKTYNTATFIPSGYTYEITTKTGETTFNLNTYPIVEGTKLPKTAFDSASNTFFQKGAGWYDITLEHRSIDILDTDSSNLTGRTKTIKTKNKSFTYGEDYFDVYRTLPGLDTGYEIVNKVDNKQRQVSDEYSSFIFNRKNIEVYLSSANAIDYDIWRKSRELLISFGSNTLEPQTGVTFAEYVDKMMSTQITNSHSIKYRKNYIKLEDIFQDYITSTGFTPYNFPDLNEFITKMSPYWTQVLDQVIPSTTLWTGGNLIENNIFGRPKYRYRFGCQPKVFIESLYPDFENAIEEDFEKILGGSNSFRGLLNATGVTYYPIIDIDGFEYGGPNYEDLTPNMTVVVSGTTNTTNSAKLFNSFPLETCDGTESSTTELPLICEYKTYLSPDIIKIKELWKVALVNLINHINSSTGNGPGYYDYDPYLNEVGENTPSTTITKVLHNFFTDVDGVEKVKFTSVKNGPDDCSVKEYLDYKFVASNETTIPNCGLELDFSFDCPDDVDPNQTYRLPSGDASDYPNGPECKLNGNLIIKITGDTSTIIQNPSDSWPLYVYNNCNYNVNPTVVSGKSFFRPDGYECTWILNNLTETDDIDLLFTDAANCDLKVKLEGINIQWLNYSGFTPSPLDDELVYKLVPKIQYRNSFNYGLGGDTYVLKYDGSGSNTDLSNYTQTYVKDIVSGDTILSATFKNCETIPSQQLLNGIENDDLSFIFNYQTKTVINKDCLGTVKKYLITGKTKQDETEVFEILQTSKVKVYTRFFIDEENGDIQDVGKYFFTERFPEHLQIKQEQEEPCCNYSNTYYQSGDYLITSEGKLIEVISTNLNYCTPNLYFNLNLSGGVPSNLVAFNGNNDYQILLQHTYDNFSRLDTNLIQYYEGGLCFDEEQTSSERNEDIVSGYDDCDIEPYRSCGGTYATPTPTPTITPTLTPTPTLTITPTLTPTQSITPTFTVTPTLTITPTITPTQSITPTLTPTISATVTPTITPTQSITPTFTITPTRTPDCVFEVTAQYVQPTPTPTFTITPTVTLDCLFNVTVSYVEPTPTPTFSLTPTITPTQSITPTLTPTQSITPTMTPNCVFEVTAEYVPPTPTPTLTITPTITPTFTITPTMTLDCLFEVSAGYVAPTPTPTLTPTQSITPTFSLTPTLTPTQSITPTFSLTPTITPTMTPDCVFEVTAAYVEPTPTPTVTLSPTITPTVTPTITPTQTCDPFVTQYLRTRLLGCSNFDLTLFNNSNLSGNASAVCDYIVYGTAYGDLGTIYNGTTTISVNDHVHTLNISAGLQQDECVTGFTVNSVEPQCDCVNVVIIPLTPTPTPTPTFTLTPTLTPTQSITPTFTITPTQSVTPTLTPTVTLDCNFTIEASYVAPTPTPTLTPTQSVTPTFTITPTLTPTQSITPTFTITPTQSITPTFTITPTQSITPTFTITPTLTLSPTITPTLTPDCDFTIEAGYVAPTPTPTITPTLTITPTFTLTPTQSITPTITPTFTITPTIDCSFEASFSEYLPVTPTPTPVEAPGEPAPCSSGMDVVFLVDYTASMGPAINGIKSSIASIANTVQTESNNNYRLGLVTFDEYSSGTISNYSSNTNYTSLPSSQRYVNDGVTGVGSRYQWITAWEKMDANNISSFTTQLNKLNGSVSLGNGMGYPEPSDIGLNLISTNNVTGYEYFAGTFRSNVSKLLILITDNYPSGNDDLYTQADKDFVNGLIPILYNQNIRVLLMTSLQNVNNNTNVLYDLATGTNGLVSYNSDPNVAFSGSSIITAIQNICP